MIDRGYSEDQVRPIRPEFEKNLAELANFLNTDEGSFTFFMLTRMMN